MLLHRAHGLGNDYLVVTDPIVLSPRRIVALCDRHTGVGSDGILEPVAPPEPGLAEYGLRIHNPDGSEAEKSGNGLRIFAHWLCHRRGAGRQFRVWTLGGVVHCEVEGDTVTVNMGPYRIGSPWMFLDQTVVPVNVGNPHAVVRGIPEDWAARGARIEVAVPGRTNVQFAEPRGPHDVDVTIWERGAGETRSSGSSACAVAVVQVHVWGGAFPVSVHMPGGTLVMNGDGDTVTQRGPVEAVGTVEVEAGWWSRRCG